MNVKAHHLRALRDNALAQLMRIVWANLMSDEPGWASVEFQTVNAAWANDIRPGMVLSAQGVRLMVDRITCQEHPDDYAGLIRHIPSLRVRIDFRRLDYVPEAHPDRIYLHRRHVIDMRDINFELGR